MTVTKGRRPTYVYPNPNSDQTSGADSLHLATPTTTDVDSESESIHLPVTGRCTIFEPLWCNRKNLGRRKQRMLFNHLRIVSEEVDDVDSNYIQLMENYKTPFARLLNDNNALSQWYEFIELPEEQQQQLTESVPKIEHTQSEDKRDNHQKKLSSRIKRAIKVKKNLSMQMVQTLENDLINYFICSPEGIFTSSPSTSFERLLLHAIANYHHLKSISVINIEIRTVQVTCNHKPWKPIDVSFCNFVKQLSQ